MIKKIIMLAVTIILSLGIASCTFRLPESEYFVYSKKSDDSIYIVGLTELGKQQEYLIIPEKIDGHDVVSLGETGWFVGGSFESKNLIKIYIMGDTIVGQSDFFKSSLNFTHLFFLKSESSNIYYGIYRDTNMTYISSFASDFYYPDNSDIYQKANLSYVYNYDNSPNNNYYFIDDYDNEIIRFTPPDPTREGYTFAGWYKEAECMNAWNFEVDKVPEKIEEYLETILYAKWI